MPTMEVMYMNLSNSSLLIRPSAYNYYFEDPYIRIPPHNLQWYIELPFRLYLLIAWRACFVGCASIISWLWIIFLVSSTIHLWLDIRNIFSFTRVRFSLPSFDSSKCEQHFQFQKNWLSFFWQKVMNEVEGLSFFSA